MNKTNERCGPQDAQKRYLVLEDGSVFGGFSFGAETAISGEVVFNTGMVGYPESFTDPSYSGQILSLTYPLIGNYGVPADIGKELSQWYESGKIHIRGLVVSEYSAFHHHWTAERGLEDLLREEGIPGIQCVDTRALTKRLRESGTMMGCITDDPGKADISEPEHGFGRMVSVKEPVTYSANSSSAKRVAVVDCGCKNTIIRSLIKRGVEVVRVPWDCDVTELDVAGVLFSNGPGDPLDYGATIENAKRVLDSELPVFGICLGNQVLALASGAKTYKLKFGHRGQNQPCTLVGEKRCFITSQNHGYAVDADTLGQGWEPWFQNLNDGTIEGIRHSSKPAMSVQFHPEAMPGPVDTAWLFDEFIGMLK